MDGAIKSSVCRRRRSYAAAAAPMTSAALGEPCWGSVPTVDGAIKPICCFRPAPAPRPCRRRRSYAAAAAAGPDLYIACIFALLHIFACIFRIFACIFAFFDMF